MEASTCWGGPAMKVPDPKATSKTRVRMTKRAAIFCAGRELLEGPFSVTEEVENADDQNDHRGDADDHEDDQEDEEAGLGALIQLLVVLALLAVDDGVEDGGEGGIVLAGLAAERLSHQAHAVAGDQTGTAAQLGAVILDYPRLQAVEGKGQRVADVYGGSVLRRADLRGVANFVKERSLDELRRTSEESAGPGSHDEDQGEQAKASGHLLCYGRRR
ncbi:hypothetical protein TYRP_011393 [Tyrophagus putrescentiae]|nr:hypothetical protein TYRP_011393 [Tyrophagus putrescentiae]